MTHYLCWSSFMQKYSPSSSHVYCVFVKSTKSNSSIAQFFMSLLANFPKTVIQYARDDEEPYFCINQNKIIKRELTSIPHFFSRVTFYCFEVILIS